MPNLLNVKDSSMNLKEQTLELRKSITSPDNNFKVKKRDAQIDGSELSHTVKR